MLKVLELIIFVVVWLALTRWILPRAGVPT